MRKGEITQKVILDQALALASAFGLEGLSIGSLAERLSLSKSGLFAHFGSKETLQIRILSTASEVFTETVIVPSLKIPRGLPRVLALFERRLAWAQSKSHHGCIFMAAAAELDDRPGPVRDHLVSVQKQWRDTQCRIARTAIDEGHFRADLDVEQFVFDSQGVFVSYQYSARLLEDPNAEQKARTAFKALLMAAVTEKGRALL